MALECKVSNHDGLESAKPDLQSLFKKPGGEHRGACGHGKCFDAGAAETAQAGRSNTGGTAAEVVSRAMGCRQRTVSTADPPGRAAKPTRSDLGADRDRASACRGSTPTSRKRFTSLIGLTRVENRRPRRRHESQRPSDRHMRGSAVRGARRALPLAGPPARRSPRCAT